MESEQDQQLRRAMEQSKAEEAARKREEAELQQALRLSLEEEERKKVWVPQTAYFLFFVFSSCDWVWEEWLFHMRACRRATGVRSDMCVLCRVGFVFEANPSTNCH